MENIHNMHDTGYHIILNGLKNKDLNEGIIDALSCIKEYMYSSNIFLYRMTDDKYYLMNNSQNIFYLKTY